VTRKQKLRVAETVLRELFDLGVTGPAPRVELTDAEWKAAAERLVEDLDKVDADQSSRRVLRSVASNADRGDTR
jgi:hypothetical protein